MPRPPTPCRTPGCPHPTHAGPHCTRCEQRTATAHRITLVCGPPCAGKNTYVREHARPGDLVVDLDALYSALNAQPQRDDHDQPDALRPFAFDARDAVIDRLFAGDHIVRAAWIISSSPKLQARQAFKARGVRIVLINASKQMCEQRARSQRPQAWMRYIDEWFAAFQPGCIDHSVPTGGPTPRQGGTPTGSTSPTAMATVDRDHPHPRG